jgi:hypothetical protein
MSLCRAHAYLGTTHFWVVSFGDSLASSHLHQIEHPSSPIKADSFEARQRLFNPLRKPHAATTWDCRCCLRQFMHDFKRPSEASMIIRQSTMKQWMECPLKVRFAHIDMLQREQSGSLIFGSIVHDCVLFLEESGDLEAALDRFKTFWAQPHLLDPEYRIDYYVRGTNWRKFLEKGEDLLRRWWHIIQWETDLVLAREYTFDVPIGDGHTLHGTVDKLIVRYRADLDTWVLLISDYKTNNKVPTYGYLEEDLQFSAYAYATLQPEFWDNMPNGTELYEKYKDLPRYGEWVQMVGAKRMDAGIRTERHLNRLIMAVNAMADSIAMRIFVPNISGETCKFCDFRKQCGLPELMED